MPLVITRDECGLCHNDDGPAIIYEDGTQIWAIHGERHRIGAPAIICPDGTEMWYFRGELHRIDGAAVEINGEPLSYYLHDKRLDPLVWATLINLERTENESSCERI